MIKRILRAAALVAIAGIVALAAWETYAIWRAERNSEAILAEYLGETPALTPDDLSEEQMRVLLTVEDPAFFTHRGIDFSSLGQGMTTLTQAIVKFLYFDAFRPGFMKIEQTLIAWLVADRHLTKEQQLMILFNHIYMGSLDGRVAYGFAEAAELWFGKPFDRLEDREFIGLVAMLIAPNTVNPVKNPAAYEDRVGRIERLLAGDCAPAGVFDPWFEGCRDDRGATTPAG